MPTFGRIAPTVPVADLGRALQFYGDVLGFDVAFTNGEPASFAVIKQGDAEIHLSVQGATAGTSHFHVMVDDLEGVYERLLQVGALIKQAPMLQEWGLRDLVVVDPDGNTIEVAQAVGESASAAR
jgi:catechol 2,3-dioxygenase-like lactoylglutathione lyase family enzyme